MVERSHTGIKSTTKFPANRQRNTLKVYDVVIFLGFFSTTEEAFPFYGDMEIIVWFEVYESVMTSIVLEPLARKGQPPHLGNWLGQIWEEMSYSERPSSLYSSIVSCLTFISLSLLISLQPQNMWSIVDRKVGETLDMHRNGNPRTWCPWSLQRSESAMRHKEEVKEAYHIELSKNCWNRRLLSDRNIADNISLGKWMFSC